MSVRTVSEPNNKIKVGNIGERLFSGINVILMLLLCFITLYPMWYVLCASFSNNTQLLANPGFMLIPRGFTTIAYCRAFSHPLIMSGYRNILIVIAVSLPINIFLTLSAAYLMASKKVLLKKPLVIIMLFTMFFQGGMVPNYLNIQSLGLYNTLWALILPSAISIYNTVICRTAIETVPDAVTESAYIDGANDIRILFQFILPLIMPTIAVLLLYYGVRQWNAWFPASLYISDNEKLPIQNILRAVLIANSTILNSAAAESDKIDQFSEIIKYAAIIITTLPIMCIYPFLQKYFVKGVMIGAVKG
ncbi:MAG TPA: carbohydrate ABC transporter permease [Candidatus Limiplasma sp.]|nr:carbohydrate ABC transporter permease [Candidatus Limiplasma sp.]